MKRVAVCLRGLQSLFFESWENFREMILQDLQQEYQVDIFINSYQTSISESIESVLHPVSALYNESRDGWSSIHQIVPTQVVECCQMIKQYEENMHIEYDYILITRFDLTFNTKFREYNIDYDKINMECMFVPDMKSGDNVFFFNRKYLDVVEFSAIECLQERSNSHNLYTWFILNGGCCHYIGGETTKRGSDYDIMFRFTRYVV